MSSNTVIYYLLIINLYTFVIWGIDKLKAKKERRRIPELQLMLLAISGGSIGAFLGMKVWRHKTLHKKFKYGIPFILVVQTALCICFTLYC